VGYYKESVLFLYKVAYQLSLSDFNQTQVCGHFVEKQTEIK